MTPSHPLQACHTCIAELVAWQWDEVQMCQQSASNETDTLSPWISEKWEASSITTMYESLQLPWSEPLSAAEREYRDAGLVKTQGTLFMLPPSHNELIESFNSPPRPKTRMSSGAVALCKHFERGGASSEHGRAHPFWSLPVGSNDNKTKLAEAILHEMLSTIAWKNVMMLHPGVAVYEIRNGMGYGMRWTIDLMAPEVEEGNSSGQEKGWTIGKVTFRGFLEPIIGMDHELLSNAGNDPQPHEPVMKA